MAHSGIDDQQHYQDEANIADTPFSWGPTIEITEISIVANPPRRRHCPRNPRLRIETSQPIQHAGDEVRKLSNMDDSVGKSGEVSSLSTKPNQGDIDDQGETNRIELCWMQLQGRFVKGSRHVNHKEEDKSRTTSTRSLVAAPPYNPESVPYKIYVKDTFQEGCNVDYETRYPNLTHVTELRLLEQQSEKDTVQTKKD